MEKENPATVDQSNRADQYEDVKGKVQHDVNAEIADEARRFSERERVQVAAVGDQLKSKALKDVIDSETEVERARGIARFSQVVDYLFYLIYGLISLQISLDLLGARRGNGFRDFIETVCGPLLAPFKGLMPSFGSGGYQLRLSYVFALATYLLLHMAINGLLRLFSSRKTAI